MIERSMSAHPFPTIQVGIVTARSGGEPVQGWATGDAGRDAGSRCASLGICSRQMCASGFTLLEVLVAIAIFAIVISTVYAAYRATFFNVGGAEQQLAATDGARVVLQRFSDDLQSLYAQPGGYLRGASDEIDDQRADSLSFTSVAHLVFSPDDPRSGLTVIRYHLEKDENSGYLRLYRSDTPERPGETGNAGEADGGEVLGEGIKEFRITYLGTDGSELDRWDSKSQGRTAQSGQAEKEKLPVMPALIKVELQMVAGPNGDQQVNFSTAIAPLRIKPRGDTG